MARPKSKTKRNGRRGASPAAAEAKGAAKMNDDQFMALFFQHKRKVGELVACVKFAQANLKEAYALAKSEGVLKKELELALALETDAGEAKARADAERIIRIARWMGCVLGTQGNLFGGEALGDRHEEDGKRAAMSDAKRKPPAELSQADAQRWMRGFDVGRAALNATRAEGFKPLGDTMAKVVDSIAAH